MADADVDEVVDQRSLGPAEDGLVARLGACPPLASVFCKLCFCFFFKTPAAAGGSLLL